MYIELEGISKEALIAYLKVYYQHLPVFKTGHIEVAVNTLDLYSGGTQFESWLVYHLS
jgi:hypothetical protein